MQKADKVLFAAPQLPFAFANRNDVDVVFAADPRPQLQLGFLRRTSRSGCRDIDLTWPGN